MTYSRKLEGLAAADDRIECYEYDPENDMAIHWLHLREPFVAWGECSIHEDTVAKCLEVARDIQRNKYAG